MAGKPEEDMATDPQMKQDIADLFEKSHILSENIYRTEQDIQNIANLLKQPQVRGMRNINNTYSKIHLIVQRLANKRLNVPGKSFLIFFSTCCQKSI